MKDEIISIKILGMGCPNCMKLESNTKEAVEAISLKAEVDKITDIETIMSYGAMSSPAFVVDGKLIFSGRVPSVEEIKKILTDIKSEQVNNNSSESGCSCGDNC